MKRPTDEDLFLEMDDGAIDGALDHALTEEISVDLSLDEAAGAGGADGGDRGEPPLPAVCLLVDDDAALLAMWATRLRRGGWHVVEASNGEIARQIALAQRPDLIVSDVHMPHASGWDLLVALQNDRVLRNTPVILLSADDPFIAQAAEANLGASVVIGKSKLRGDDIVTLAQTTASTELELLRCIARRVPALCDLRRVSPARALWTFARTNARGRWLVDCVEQSGRRYEIHVGNGNVSSAGVYTQGSFNTDVRTVIPQLVDERDGRARFEHASVSRQGVPVDTLLRELSGDTGGAPGDVDLANAGAFTLDARRYQLYMRLALPADAHAAQLVLASGSLLKAITESADPLATDRVVVDLLRKGVIRLSRTERVRR